MWSKIDPVVGVVGTEGWRTEHRSIPCPRSVHISPDGEHIAYLAPLGGVSNLWVASAADLQSGRPLTHAADRDLGGNFRWRG